MKRAVTIDDLISSVATEFDMTTDEIRTVPRERRVVEARAIVMYLAGRLTQMSQPEIGRAFGKVHGVVTKAQQQVPRLLDRDPDLALRIGNLERSLRGGVDT